MENKNSQLLWERCWEDHFWKNKPVRILTPKHRGIYNLESQLCSQCYHETETNNPSARLIWGNFEKTSSSLWENSASWLSHWFYITSSESNIIQTCKNLSNRAKFTRPGIQIKAQTILSCQDRQCCWLAFPFNGIPNGCGKMCHGNSSPVEK